MLRSDVDDLHMRMRAADPLDAVVAGRVVDDDDLEPVGGQSSWYRLSMRSERVVAPPVVDEDDRDAWDARRHRLADLAPRHGASSASTHHCGFRVTTPCSSFGVAAQHVEAEARGGRGRSSA